MFYLLHGNDEFTCREQLKKLKREEDYGYNQDFYTGGEVSLITLTATCNTFPFLTEKRLVVLEGLPKRKRGEEASDSEARAEQAEKPKKGKKGKASTETRAGFEKGLAEYIPQMPESTVLIVLVDEELSASSPILKAAQQHGKVIQCTLPKGQAIEGWIVKRAQSIGVKITPEAAKLLADFIGNQLRLLANELDKLATYVGERKVIDVEDVRRLSAQVQEARIFDLTDALAARDRKKALNLLHELLADGEPPLKLISTITSQVRSLLLVKELADEGLRIPQIVSATGMAPFIAEKALRQIGKFKAEQIETAYRQLLATDAALKRSRLTPEMALDLLVVNFGNA
ncbi:MAG TPA: DNA polymerase III subunit delta [Ktedonobacteraceae bacterium]|jgi:DNA polymerase-3 subunit delta|nr:DNA polymerase III subunit delta [Ktedonobacteraceae bacterium]